MTLWGEIMSFILLIPFLLWLFLMWYGRLELRIQYKYGNNRNNKNNMDNGLAQNGVPRLTVFFVLSGIGRQKNRRNFKIKLVDMHLLSIIKSIKIRFECLFFKIWPGRNHIEIERNVSFKLNKIKNVTAQIPDKNKCQLLKKSLKITCQKFKVRLEYCLLNPAVTAIIYGLSWQVVSLFLTIMAKVVFIFESPDIGITPLWQEAEAQSGCNFQLDVIFSVKPVNIIITGIKMQLLKIYNFFSGIFKNKMGLIFKN